MDEDDAKLRQVVEDNRIGDYIPWEVVSGLMEGRTRAQCQNRWTRKLDPNLKTGRWTKEEDDVSRAYFLPCFANFLSSLVPVDIWG